MPPQSKLNSRPNPLDCVGRPNGVALQFKPNCPCVWIKHAFNLNQMRFQFDSNTRVYLIQTQLQFDSNWSYIWIKLAGDSTGIGARGWWNVDEQGVIVWADVSQVWCCSRITFHLPLHHQRIRRWVTFWRFERAKGVKWKFFVLPKFWADFPSF